MKSFISYLGGKSLLAKKIIPLIPEHHCYCEPFCGAAWILFKRQESEVEILNDINSDLVTLYRVVKLHLEEFIRYLKWVLVSRDEFERLKLEDVRTLTDIQRAVRFYYLIRTGYGARIKAPTFSISTLRPSNFNLLRIEEDLSAAHLRLARVYIENSPYQKILTRFDKPDTFFYIDPPYFGCEDYYGDGIFSPDDFKILHELLINLKGKFILSINDTPDIRQTFSGFEVREAETLYSLNGAANKKRVTELLYMNFTPKEMGVL